MALDVEYQVESTLHGILENSFTSLEEAAKLAMKHKKSCCKNHNITIIDVFENRYELIRSY